MGIPQEAARREWIVIAPSVELDDVLDEIAEVKRLYPVDESRIYAAGFSYGGFMANFLATKDRMYMRPWHRAAPISMGS
ncbi:MAG: prolyl oligopeptidase family serine peptidase [Ruthenibacterium lactatiformans]